jgi:hypothetical protein
MYCTFYCIGYLFVTGSIPVRHICSLDWNFTINDDYDDDRSPCGNFEYFVNKLDKVLKLLYKPKSEFIICGDFNVNFLKKTARKTQVLLLLQSYNTFHTLSSQLE